jgi:hypothetical protein
MNKEDYIKDFEKRNKEVARKQWDSWIIDSTKEEEESIEYVNDEDNEDF